MANRKATKTEVRQREEITALKEQIVDAAAHATLLERQIENLTAENDAMRNLLEKASKENNELLAIKRLVVLVHGD